MATNDLDVSALERCLNTLKQAHRRLGEVAPDTLDHDIYRAAAVKEFELILEIVVKLLRKVLREYVTSTRELAEMTFKNIFRTAASHGLFTPEELDRWFQYRDNRNDTAHEYGKNFAERTIIALPDFIGDAEAALLMMRHRA